MGFPEGEGFLQGTVHQVRKKHLGHSRCVKQLSQLRSGARLRARAQGYVRPCLTAQVSCAGSEEAG